MNGKVKLHGIVCAGCGKKFFSKDRRAMYCSRSCSSKNKSNRIVPGGYSYKKYSENKNRERNERLKERDRKAAAWLGKDAEGSVRGRVGGAKAGSHAVDFCRWY